MLPDHLESVRHRRPVAADRFEQNGNGAWVQTAESLHQDEEHIADLLPIPLQRTLAVRVHAVQPMVHGQAD